MLVGINYPWIDYGWDFGDPPPGWVADENLTAWREKKRKQIEEDFRQFAAQGIFAVRWFLLADGTNYGAGKFAPQKRGEDWIFDPLPAGHPFYGRLHDDFEFVLKTCGGNGLKLLPSLIDFHWCHQGTAVGGNSDIIKGGRYDVVRDPGKRSAFFQRVLDPLLEISARCSDSIYAWELINEPEWVVRKFCIFRKNDRNRNVSRKEMTAFIAEGIRRISRKLLPDGRSAFRSSVGFAHWKSLRKWKSSRLGITLHQFHYYAQKNRDLPPHVHAEDNPCVVGEFASAAGREWPDLKRQLKNQTMANRLCCIEDRGYPACFVWSARAMDPSTRWTAEEHEEVLAYTGFSKPEDLRA